MERECPAFAYRAGILEGGFFRHLEFDDFVDARDRPEALVWIDLTVRERELTRRFLIQDFGFHPLAVQDALSREERPSLHQSENGFFLELAVLDPSVAPEKAAEIPADVGIFVRSNLVVTVCDQPVPLLRQVFGSWADRPQEVGPRAEVLLHELLDHVVDSYFPVIDRLHDQIEDLEDQIYQGTHFEVGAALSIKRNLLTLRRRLAPLRDVLNGSYVETLRFVTADLAPYYQDVYDHSLRVLENLDLGRDLLSTILDAQLNMTSNRLNEVMRVMTVAATVLMTMALVAGIYGMNFEAMPELSWPMGYAFAWALMLVLAGFEIWLFRRKGWV